MATRSRICPSCGVDKTKEEGEHWCAHKSTPLAPLNKDEVTEREKIRRIWRPLYDLGYKGAEQIDAQYMALLITQAVDETQALLNNQIREAKEAVYEQFKEELPQFHVDDPVAKVVGECLRACKRATLKDKVE